MTTRADRMRRHARSTSASLSSTFVSRARNIPTPSRRATIWPVRCTRRATWRARGSSRSKCWRPVGGCWGPTTRVHPSPPGGCVTLHNLGEREAARAVLEHDLLWLLDRDPATLGADQREAREYVAQAVKKSG